MDHINTIGTRHSIYSLRLNLEVSTPLTAPLQVRIYSRWVWRYIWRTYKRDLDEEGIELLVKKKRTKKNSQTHLLSFSPSFILLGSYLVSETSFYDSDFDPHSNFLNLNSSSLRLYVPYHTCYDDVICTQEGSFVNSYIDKPALFCRDAFHVTWMLFYPAVTLWVSRQNKDIFYLPK